MSLKNFGFIWVNKPASWTSFDVCNRLKKLTGVKRIGHTGTLDPFATGLLLVAFGKATKLIPYFEKNKKSYEATITLGATTETLDPEGEVVFDNTFEGLSEISETRIKEVLNSFTGEIKQIPPKYSALKINGQRAYDLARKGESVEMKVRETEVFEVQLLNILENEITVGLTVAAGFYVRSFARDVAEKLDTLGYCSALKRTEIGDFKMSGIPMVLSAQELDKTYTGTIEPFVLCSRQVLPLPMVEIPFNRVDDFKGGRVVRQFINHANIVEKQTFLVISGEEEIGIGELICGAVQPRTSF